MKEKVSEVLRSRIPLFGISIEAALTAFFSTLFALAIYKWILIPLLEPYGEDIVKVIGILVGIGCIIYSFSVIISMDKLGNED